MTSSLRSRVFPALALVAAASMILAPVKAGACAWSISPSPNYDVSKFGHQLESVSADSATDAWAIGHYQNAKTFLNYTLAEHWNGANWQIVSSPNPGIDAQFFGVAALTASNVWAVGSASIQNKTASLIEHWNGKNWSVVSSPASGTLLSVKAVSANDIWAVGVDANKTLILHWNGITWSRVASPSPSAKQSLLDSVTASSPKDAWAVGGYYTSKSLSFTEHWNGTKWNMVSTSAPSTRDYALNGIAALSANDVFTVGYYFPSTGSFVRTLGEHWNGSRWVVQTTPTQRDQDTEFSALAAVSPTEVIAVGYGGNTLFGATTFAARWTGTQWITTSTPNATANNILTGASTIPGTSDVWAVGSTFDASGNPRATLIERYHC